MSEHNTLLYTLLAVLAILLAVLLYNNSRARREVPREPEGEDAGLEDDYLLRFVRHEGDVVGETFAREGDRLILKQAGVFKSVPLALASVDKDEVVLEGDIDWEQAIADGTAWHEANTRGHDPLVTEHLTRSEDVRSPALDAMADRDSEE